MNSFRRDVQKQMALEVELADKVEVYRKQRENPSPPAPLPEAGRGEPDF